MPHAPFRFVAVFAVLLCAACATNSGARTRSTAVSLSAEVTHGSAIFQQQCAACHGAAGDGGPIGPALRGERERRSYAWVRAQISDPAPPMPKLFPSQLSAADVRDVAAYVESL